MTMLYEQEKSALLAACLPDIERLGFLSVPLEEVGARVGLDAHRVRLAFPRGGVDMAIYFVQSGTRNMAAQLAEMDLGAMKVRTRISEAVMCRLLCDAPHKKVAKRAFTLLALPAYADDALSLLYETVDAMWYAAGDNSTDWNFYSKRAILAGVYMTTRLVWFADESAECKKTRDFLARRIDNVMQIEKGKAALRKAKAGLPDIWSVVARWRYEH